MTTHALDLDVELTQYVETALWSSLDDDGAPMDDTYDASDIAPEALESMRADLIAFTDSVDAAMLDLWHAELGEGQVGHDFWLTRNGHGCGFWDRFSAGINARIGNTLSDAARAFGESYLYVGDDGRLYA